MKCFPKNASTLIQYLGITKRKKAFKYFALVKILRPGINARLPRPFVPPLIIIYMLWICRPLIFILGFLVADLYITHRRFRAHCSGKTGGRDVYSVNSSGPHCSSYLAARHCRVRETGRKYVFFFFFITLYVLLLLLYSFCRVRTCKLYI